MPSAITTLPRRMSESGPTSWVSPARTHHRHALRLWQGKDCQGQPDTHFAAAFRSRKKAAGLVAELLASED